MAENRTGRVIWVLLWSNRHMHWDTHTHPHTHVLPHRLETAQSPHSPQPKVCKVADVTSFPKLRPISEGSLEFIRKKLTVCNFGGRNRVRGGRPLACCNIVCLLDPLVVWGFLAVETSPQNQGWESWFCCSPAELLLTTYTARPDHLHMWFQFSGSLWENVSICYQKDARWKEPLVSTFWLLPRLHECPAHPPPHIMFNF